MKDAGRAIALNANDRCGGRLEARVRHCELTWQHPDGAEGVDDPHSGVEGRLSQSQAAEDDDEGDDGCEVAPDPPCEGLCCERVGCKVGDGAVTVDHDEADDDEQSAQEDGGDPQPLGYDSSSVFCLFGEGGGFFVADDSKHAEGDRKADAGPAGGRFGRIEGRGTPIDFAGEDKSDREQHDHSELHREEDEGASDALTDASPCEADDVGGADDAEDPPWNVDADRVAGEVFSESAERGNAGCCDEEIAGQEEPAEDESDIGAGARGVPGEERTG